MKTQPTTIRSLIKELLSYSNVDIEVNLSFDGGDTLKPIQLVGRIDGKCVLLNFDEQKNEIENNHKTK